MKRCLACLKCERKSYYTVWNATPFAGMVKTDGSGTERCMRNIKITLCFQKKWYAIGVAAFHFPEDGPMCLLAGQQPAHMEETDSEVRDNALSKQPVYQKMMCWLFFINKDTISLTEFLDMLVFYYFYNYKPYDLGPWRIPGVGPSEVDSCASGNPA